MKKYTFCILFLFSLFGKISYSQNNTAYNYDSFIDSSSNFVDFGYYRFVGIGEGTHSSAEYYTERFKLIKLLINNYNYRNIYVEASLIHVHEVDRYLQNSDSQINLVLLVKNFGNILFKNYNFVEIIQWIKDFNLIHPNDPVHLFGIDFTGYDPNHQLKDSNFYNLSSDIYSDIYNLCKDNNHVYNKARLKCFNNILTNISLHKWNTYFDSLKMVCFAWSCFVDDAELYGKSKYRALRENYMLFNISTINTNMPMKSIVLAHNSHVANNKSKLGYYINKRFPYYPIAMTSLSGSFYAYDASHSYQFDTFRLDTTVKSIINCFKLDSNVGVVFRKDYEHTKKDFRNVLSIGTVIYNYKNSDIFYSYPFRPGTFLAIILIKEITTVELIHEFHE